MAAAIRALPELGGAALAIAPIGDPEPERLGPAERACFEALPSTDRRRREWFAGRDVARRALEAVGGAGLQIVADARGIPRLEGPRAEQFTVALSHGQRTAVAVASTRASPLPCVGVDLLDPRDQTRVQRFADRVFTAEERAFSQEHEHALLLAWGAREAFAKASATGMFAFALHRVHLRAIDAASRRLTLNQEETLGLYEPFEGGWLVLVATAEATAQRARAVAGLA